jgi:phosphoenolpyruvate carboxykinase (ATP)
MPSTALTSPIDLSKAAEIVRNPSIEQLIEDCLAHDDCKLASNGAVVAYTGKYTGRTPKDKVTLRQPTRPPHAT